MKITMLLCCDTLTFFQDEIDEAAEDDGRLVIDPHNIEASFAFQVGRQENLVSFKFLFSLVIYTLLTPLKHIFKTVLNCLLLIFNFVEFPVG